mgnify:CR=1 FL=1
MTGVAELNSNLLRCRLVYRSGWTLLVSKVYKEPKMIFYLGIHRMYNMIVSATILTDLMAEDDIDTLWFFRSGLG